MHGLLIILTCTSCRYSCATEANGFDLCLSRDAREMVSRKKEMYVTSHAIASAQQNRKTAKMVLKTYIAITHN